MMYTRMSRDLEPRYEANTCFALLEVIFLCPAGVIIILNPPCKLFKCNAEDLNNDIIIIFVPTDLWVIPRGRVAYISGRITISG